MKKPVDFDHDYMKKNPQDYVPRAVGGEDGEGIG